MKCKMAVETGAMLLVMMTLMATDAHVAIVKPRDRKITVQEGSDVTLECQHGPGDEIMWKLQGMEIDNITFPRFRMEKLEHVDETNHVTSRLTVGNINRTDAGHYECVNADLEKATFDQNQKDAADVKVMRRIVLEIEGPANATVVEGADLLLICKGDRTSQLIWFFEDNKLSESSNVTIITEEQTENYIRLALTVHRVTADNAGSYRCHDQLNKAASTIQIQVDSDIRTESVRALGIRTQSTVSYLFATLFLASVAAAAAAATA